MESLNREYAFNTEISAPPVKVEVDDRLADAPYFVGINPTAFGNLLSELGASDDFISTTTVRLEPRSDRQPKSEGNFSSDGTVSIYTEPLWEKYQKAVRESQKISQGKRRAFGNPYKGILHTKRLPNYLRAAPPERALRFAEKLINQGIQERAIETALHEARHAGDYATGVAHNQRLYRIAEKLRLPIAAMNSYYVFSILPPDNLLNVGGAIGIGIFSYKNEVKPIVYFFDPMERNARKFAKKNQDDPRYKDLIVFGVKPGNTNA